MPHSSFGQPTTALRLPEPLATPWNHQRSMPSSPSTDSGRLIPPPIRHVSLEHVGRLDHVIVAADQNHILELHALSLRLLGRQ